MLRRDRLRRGSSVARGARRAEQMLRPATLVVAIVTGLAVAGCGGVPTSPSPSRAGVVSLTSSNFDQQVLGRSGAAMVEFFRTTCPHCQAMVPTVEQLAAAYIDRALVADVDVSTQTVLTSTYKIEYVPTFVFFKNGREVSRIVGEESYASLSAALDAAMASP